MLRRVAHLFRITLAALHFLIFGVGALFLIFFIFSIIRITSFSRGTYSKRIRYVLHLSFKLFAAMMQAAGLIKVKIIGREILRKSRSMVITANHPTLLDIVLLIACIPRADCIIKESLTKNPFFGYIVRNTYIPNNSQPDKLLEDCRKSLMSGNSLVIFPEGTRTVPNSGQRLSRSAAHIALRAEASVLPVQISCTPPALMRNQSLWSLPNERLQFVIRVCPPIDTQRYLAKKGSLHSAAIELTDEMRIILFKPAGSC